MPSHMSPPRPNTANSTAEITEALAGVVDRVTFHNPESGWSVLRVSPFSNPHQQEIVIVHQTKVFAGATMEFHGAWIVHPQYGRQFKASRAIEKKPATAAALEKYLGSGLIKGVGPKTARKIVKHFGDKTLSVFEENIESLTSVPGIAEKKLAMIEKAWAEHRAIRDVMMFLQSHGISTLFAVKIYKEYGGDAIAVVTDDPYRLAQDVYGIGFFSADNVAASIGIEKDSPKRIEAGIRHVLAASRDFGHCYLTETQIAKQTRELLQLDLQDKLPGFLARMEREGQLKVRELASAGGAEGIESCFYSKTLYYDEQCVAEKIKGFGSVTADDAKIAVRINNWLERYCRSKAILLSDEQASAIKGIVSQGFSVLTGGPGCGKTTATLTLVRLLEAMGLRVALAAPTGRAAQRMTEVIGREAKTIHRLLEWQGSQFKRNEENPLQADFLAVDECSMLDISLTAALLKAVPPGCGVLFIGDAEQLPSVGAGNVLRDIINSNAVPCFKLTKIFRQAQESQIIRFAHEINQGRTPRIESPFKYPDLWQQGADCLFMDSDEATQEQLKFINRIKRIAKESKADSYALEEDQGEANLYEFRAAEGVTPYETEFQIPKKFQHVDLDQLCQAENQAQELLTILKKVHPWSSLRYGLSAADSIRNLYLEWIPKYFGKNCEIQILSPMTRGSLGTANLNKMLQDAANPGSAGKHQIKIGERILREGDRVIHRRNNYDLNVFNGDIGVIKEIDNEDLSCKIAFYPEGRVVHYKREDLLELDLAYAITIHKSQGSEFEAAIIPVTTQHFKMLHRNLIYTGLTRAKRLAVLVGTRKALALAVKNQDTSRRQTALEVLLCGQGRT